MLGIVQVLNDFSAEHHSPNRLETLIRLAGILLLMSLVFSNSNMLLGLSAPLAKIGTLMRRDDLAFAPRTLCF